MPLTECQNVDTPTPQQLQVTIAQLDQAIYNHEQWYKNVTRVLILRIPPEGPDLMPDAHRRCLFGQWYESLSEVFLKEHPTFVSLGPVHENMHISARVLLKRVADGLPISVEDFDRFNNLLDNMRLEFQALRHELAEMVQNRDPLTGARNRASLLAYLREQQALVERGVQVCSIAMVDLDHFKRVNDEHGHAAGDAVLVVTVKCLQALVRQYDRIYRYGGEEFLVCMPGITLEQARNAAERMRVAIADQGVPYGTDQSLRVTASFGVASITQSRSVEDCIACADKAMYAAKAAGRNCVSVEP